jgi:hypothetical protein
MHLEIWRPTVAQGKRTEAKARREIRRVGLETRPNELSVR